MIATMLGRDRPTPLVQLIYVSRPFGFTAVNLDDILAVSKLNNARDGITGALICRGDVFVQLLEGPRLAVTRCFGRILQDDRHIDVTLVWCGDTLVRRFPEWEMRDDPVRSWMWSQAEIRAGAARTAGAAVFRRIFDRLADEPKMAVAF